MTSPTRDGRTRTHIKTLMQELKAHQPDKLAQPAGLFMSGMLTGLAAAVQILDGGTAEAAMEATAHRLEAAVGRAYLNGTLPEQPSEEQATPSDTDQPLSREAEIRGVQGWMALDVHRALGLPVDDQADHQGHPSWPTWWSVLCGHIAQRTRAAHQRAQDLAVPDALTFHNARQWGVHPELARPERMFFPIAYGAVLAEAHPITPDNPPYMIDLSGYEDGDPLQERVLRLIVHRSLATRLARDITALETTPDAEPPTNPSEELARLQFIYEENKRRHEGAIARVDELLAEVARTEAERDGAYRERAHLVALLAAMTDGAVIAPAPDVDEPGWQIAYLTIGGRQASWHISPRDADLVACVPHVSADHPAAQWDGHTTDDKYDRIRQHTRALFHQCGPACAEGHTYTGRCEGAPAQEG